MIINYTIYSNVNVHLDHGWKKKAICKSWWQGQQERHLGQPISMNGIDHVHNCTYVFCQLYVTQLPIHPISPEPRAPSS